EPDRAARDQAHGHQKTDECEILEEKTGAARMRHSVHRPFRCYRVAVLRSRMFSLTPPVWGCRLGPSVNYSPLRGFALQLPDGLDHRPDDLNHGLSSRNRVFIAILFSDHDRGERPEVRKKQRAALPRDEQKYLDRDDHDHWKRDRDEQRVFLEERHFHPLSELACHQCSQGSKPRSPHYWRSA